jgi:hypothetical protein
MLRSLLLSRDETTIRIVGRVFKDLEVELEHLPESAAALLDLTKNRYHAIIVDDAVTEAHIVLERLIEFPSCNKSVRIALVDPALAMNAIFKTGTQVILYKPLSAERVRHGLRAVRNLMARDRRHGAKRVPTMVEARVSPRQARSAAKHVLIADLSDSGAAIHSEMGDLPTSGTINIEFTLPGTLDLIHATAELVWRDKDGAAGLRFLDMPSYARKRLTQWLKEHPGDKVVAATARAGR